MFSFEIHVFSLFSKYLILQGISCYALDLVTSTTLLNKILLSVKQLRKKRKRTNVHRKKQNGAHGFPKGRVIYMWSFDEFLFNYFTSVLWF